MNPFAIEQIKQFQPDYPTTTLRSKSWDEFAAVDAPKMDLIITVCDNAAGEACPFWAGRPATAHWGFEDPAAVAGTDEEKRAAFAQIFQQLLNKVRTFSALRIETMDAPTLQQSIKDIGAAPVLVSVLA